MASRFHPAKYGNGGVGGGLGTLARQDREKWLARCLEELRHKPVTFNGVHYLGTDAMPPKVYQRFKTLYH